MSPLGLIAYDKLQLTVSTVFPWFSDICPISQPSSNSVYNNDHVDH